MTYPGDSRTSTWLFSKLTGNSRIVELMGHDPGEDVYRISLGVSPEVVVPPCLYFSEMNARPIVGTVNNLLRAKVQFSVFAPHNNHQILAEMQRLLRELFQPEDYPTTALSGTLRILYVSLSPEGGAMYEDTPRRCLRLDHRIEFGYFD